MTRLDALLTKLAGPRDRDQFLQAGPPTVWTRIFLIARIGYRFIWAYVALLVVAIVWVAASGMDVYHRTEMPQFCNGCHEMGGNFDTWSSSRHGGIKCIDCHAKPGISGYVEAKLGGIHQLVTHLTAKTIADIKLGPSHEDTVSANCERCHEETARASDRRGRVMAHKRHREMKITCIACHSGNVAHPTLAQSRDPVAGVVDTGRCYQCHDGNHVAEGRKAFDAKDEANCVRCHPDAKFGAAHVAHPKDGRHYKPCLDCHALQEAKNHYFMDKTDQGKLCARCHQIDRPLASMHKPFREGQCDKCHTVMVPAFLFRTGPKADQKFCLGCHTAIATAVDPAQPATLTAFSDPEEDHHRQHAADVGGPDLCLQCHGGHGGPSERGLLTLRGDGSGDPGHWKGTATGGSCTGACHGTETVQYDRKGNKPPPAMPAAQDSTAAAAPAEEDRP